MRILIAMFAVVGLTACANDVPLPPVALPDLTVDDHHVLSAMLDYLFRKPSNVYREQLKQQGIPTGPSATIFVADHTLRVCEPPDFKPSKCADPSLDNAIAAYRLQLRARNERSYRMRPMLGSDVVLMDTEFYFGLSGTAPNRHALIRRRYPETGRRFVVVRFTAPVYPRGGQAVVFVYFSESLGGAGWYLLHLAGDEWNVDRALGGYVQ
jgi:hypothetical protein